MRFRIKKKQVPKIVSSSEMKTASKFSRKLYQEFGDFIQAIILFGSVAKNVPKKDDIDILVILDDVKINFTQELVQTYRIILERIVADVDPKRLHIQSMKLTSFWEYVRVGDPVAINMLRYGTALVDTGFFDPLQALLDSGRIRPSKESVYAYFTMAPASLHRSKQHLLTATIDLYWATIDSAHAVLMSLGEIPPSPDHVADMLNEKLVKQKLLPKKYTLIMNKFYKVFKGIIHREIKEISGSEYDEYKKLANDFINKMQKIIEKK